MVKHLKRSYDGKPERPFNTIRIRAAHYIGKDLMIKKNGNTDIEIDKEIEDGGSKGA